MGATGRPMPEALRKMASPVLRLVSPRHRRWHQILTSCTLDLADLPATLPAPGADDVIICGSPRTGTALLTAQLHQPPLSIGVMEPWDVLRLAPQELFASLRTELVGGRLLRGRLDYEALETRGRVAWCGDGEMPYPVDATPRSVVAVKYPGMWRYLDRLPTTKFVVCLRNPVDTIISFRTTGGRLLDGLQYEVPFEATLNAQILAAHDDLARRRVALYDTINEAILPHLGRPEVFVVRYERWFTDPEVMMAELGAFLDRDLGPGPVRIAAARPQPTTDEAEYILRTCTTAEALGY